MGTEEVNACEACYTKKLKITVEYPLIGNDDLCSWWCPFIRHFRVSYRKSLVQPYVPHIYYLKCIIVILCKSRRDSSLCIYVSFI